MQAVSGRRFVSGGVAADSASRFLGRGTILGQLPYNCGGVRNAATVMGAMSTSCLRRLRKFACVKLLVKLFIVDLSVFRAVRFATAQQGDCL